MSRGLVVHGPDDELVQRLKLRAARHNRSAEAEHREVLKQAWAASRTLRSKRLAAQLRALTRGRRHTPAEDLLREGRGER